jgi:hypothetical protein
MASGHAPLALARASCCSHRPTPRGLRNTEGAKRYASDRSRRSLPQGKVFGLYTFQTGAVSPIEKRAGSISANLQKAGAAGLFDRSRARSSGKEEEPARRPLHTNYASLAARGAS